MRGDWEGVDFSFKDEFGATLSGMMGALAEIQKKGDTMLGSIRCAHLYENILGQTEFMKTVV